uniref:hypothetical protein n=1 Tax=Parasphingorhabdus sp. TaxID=2709688 RepID=UPI003593EA04
MLRPALVLIGFFGLATAGTALLSAQATEPGLSEQRRSLVDAREQSERARQRSDALLRQAQAANNDADRAA